MEKNPTYYSIMPATVRYDVGLNGSEKTIYSEISALANKHGYCYASNAYFAELYKVSNRTVSRWINKLKERGYINVIMKYHGNTKGVKERRIYLTTESDVEGVALIDKNVNRGIDEGVYRGGNEGVHRGIDKSVRDNNTRVNNTSINNIYTTTTNNKLYSGVEESEQEVVSGQLSVKDVLEFYQQNYGILSPHISQDIQHWCNDLSPEVVQEALKRALEQEKAYAYAKGIMRNWANRGVTTLEQVEQLDIKFQRNHTKPSNVKELETTKEQSIFHYEAPPGWEEESLKILKELEAKGVKVTYETD